jgi:hypothetical protein
MRISALPGHPDHHAECENAIVYLNGEELVNCLFASEEDRFAYCYATKRGGSLLTLGDEIKVEVKFGQIVIDFRTAQFAQQIGFDVWMQTRRDLQHRHYMARHAGGGREYTSRVA